MSASEPILSQTCDLEAYLSAPILAKFLQEVARGIRSGELVLGTGDPPRTIRVGDSLLFEMHLIQGNGPTIAVDISWRRVDSSGADHLVITS